MRSKLPDVTDPEGIIALNCEPGLSPERQAEARRAAQRLFGPAAELVLRACDQAAAAERARLGLERELGRLVDGPRLRGVVVGVQNGRVRVAIAGTERDLARPAELALAIGQTVLVDAEGRAVVAAGEPLVGGQTYEYCEPLDGRHALVRPLREAPHDDLRQLALVSDAVDLDGLAPGDRVLGCVLDAGNLVLVTRRLGAVRPPIADLPGLRRPVAREDIIGLEEPIEEVELLFFATDEPAYAKPLERVSGAYVGACFYGPTGCGKSLLSEWVIGRVRAAGGRVIARTASHYLSRWVGQGAAALRKDFESLDAAWTETGVRPLLVIDELEAVALDRTLAVGIHAGSLDVLDTLLHLLTHTPGRVIGISNVARRVIDPALLRDGRLRPVGFPATLTAVQVTRLVERCLEGVPLAGGSARDFGDVVSDCVFAPDGPLARLVAAQLADGRVLTFGAPDLASGAAIADGLVRRTILRGLRRDRRAGLPAPAPLSPEALRAEAVRYFRERAATITRDNIRSVLADRLPEDQAVVRVEPLHGKETDE
jgi:hypothetical protein